MSNHQALEVFLQTPINYKMIQALVHNTLKVLPCPEDAYPSPKSSPNPCDTKKKAPSLFSFISRIVKESSTHTGTLMATLVYLKRLHEKLPADATAQDPSTRHRIFLACLILSAKFHNDSSPKNKDWAHFTGGIFDIFEVNEMESQLLFLLDWDVSVSNPDLFAVLKDFLEPIKQEINNIVKLQNFLSHQRQSQTRKEKVSKLKKSMSLATTTSFKQTSKSIDTQQKIARSTTEPNLLQYPQYEPSSSPDSPSIIVVGKATTVKRLQPPVYISPSSKITKNAQHEPKIPDTLPSLPPIDKNLNSHHPKSKNLNYRSVQYARSINSGLSSLSNSSSNASLGSTLSNSSSVSSVFSQNPGLTNSDSYSSFCESVLDDSDNDDEEEDYFLQPVPLSESSRDLFNWKYQLVEKNFKPKMAKKLEMNRQQHPLAIVSDD
ncbi:Pcl1 protein [Saccharomycopsis crataegensis]|uniref:Pcl1 protein n=1 Tax=Saccharomycopsis crataegensis TaxID=43959 RepID=A0AAV5QUR6_9ASCO|nr:Pcl1 protein [Saccharomycopsis crataegensis]